MIILLNGFSRCGKDTVSTYLQNKYHFNHIKISQKVKEVVSVMFDISKEELEDDRKDDINMDYGITPRDMMKFVGTHVGQYELNKVLPDMGRSFWICSAIKQIDQEKNYVISDYRFPHEATSLMNAFPSTKIVIVKIEPQFEAFTKPKVIDETEMQLRYDHVLINKTIAQLYQDIDALILKLKNY